MYGHDGAMVKLNIGKVNLGMKKVTDRLDLSGLKRCSAWVTRSVTRLADRLRQIIAKVF